MSEQPKDKPANKSLATPEEPLQYPPLPQKGRSQDADRRLKIRHPVSGK
jgi:hypothetical protein